MSPAISVCIPVYATERSLPACLHSVAAQRGMEAAGLEIIVVDDASPAADPELSSPARIVAQFQQESPWPVVYLEHQENKGILEARRTAVQAATGEFIFCLDSDDTLPPAALATLYHHAMAEDADIVHGRAQVVVNREHGCILDSQREATLMEKVQCRARATYLGRLKDGEILQSVLVDKTQNTFLWGKLIRRELYLHALDSIPSVYCSMADDLLQYVLIAHHACSYFGIGEVVYNYTINTGISSHTKITSLERWGQVCSAASVFTVLFHCAKGIRTPFSSEQMSAIRDLCRFYLINNLQQLQFFVVPELYHEAYELLCEFWGAGFVHQAERFLQEK